jgi:uncharacterized membrane protein (Fun14 family)
MGIGLIVGFAFGYAAGALVAVWILERRRG